MAKPIYSKFVQTSNGAADPSASFTVKDEETGLDVTIYSDREGTTPIAGGPTYFVDSNGLAKFFYEDGITIRVAVTGATGTHTDRYQEGRLFGGNSGNSPRILDFQIDSIASLPPATGSGRKVSVTGYHAGATVGGGKFVDIGLARHNGGTIIDPNRSGEIGTDAYYVDSGVDANCFARSFNGSIEVSFFGAVLDGSANDTAALVAMDAAGGGVISGGIVRVQSNISLVSDYSFSSGGIIAPDSIYTVTWSGAITAGDYRIFDGSFKLTKVHKVSEIKVAWFGAVSSDLDADMGNVSLAEANAKAIRRANSFCQIGGADGIYVTPALSLLQGLCLVDDDDNDGSIIDLKSYQTIRGTGWSSVIRPVDNGKAFSVIKCTDDGANNIYLDDFQIYGEASQQVNTQHGIDMSPPSSPIIYSKIGAGVKVKEINGNGIRVTGAGMDNSVIEPARVRDSSLTNLFVNACDRLTVRNGIYRTAKSGNHGILFDGAGCLSAVIENNLADENNGNGIYLSNVSGRFQITGNRCQSNFTGSGIFLEGSDNCLVDGNFVEQNGQDGVLLDQSSATQISNNRISSNSRFGIIMASSSNCQITSNLVTSNGSLSSNTYDGINIQSNSDNNSIQSNSVRNGTDQRYGIRVEDAASSGNMVLNNDILNAGLTASFSDAGTGTITTSGNRV